MTRRQHDTTSSSDGSGNKSGESLQQGHKRSAYDKCATPKSKIMKTPISHRTPRTGNRTGGGGDANARILRVADPIGVFCRIRPWGQSDEERCVKILNEKSIVLTPPDNSPAWKAGTAKESTYSFQKVYGAETHQPGIFQEIGLPLVEDLLKGRNALLFAYGVTGSGKTYTMSGAGEDQGVMPRCLDVIFNSISKCQARKFVFKPDRLNGFDVQTQADAMLDKQKELHAMMKTPVKTRSTTARTPRTVATPGNANAERLTLARTKETRSLPLTSQDSQYAVFVTYVEIYNNFVYDLLDENCWDERAKKFNLQSKMLREDANHNVYVNGATEIEVCTSDEAFEVFHRGQMRRKQAHTALNTASSRSHAIFTVRLVQAPWDAEGEEVCEDKDKICVSQLSLVDLAGSERYGRTQATGDRLKEAGNINNSLMVLRKCMDILRDNQQSGSSKPVPYRDTKIVHYLKNYFDGEGRVRMIICLNPRKEDYDENLHVMTFAELTQEVQIVRPSEKKLDPFTPGRRKANEIFKEARRRIVEEIPIEEKDIPVDINAVYGLGAPLPLGQMSKSEEEHLIESLRRALEERVRSRTDLQKLLVLKRHNVRMQLVDFERKVQSVKQENDSLKYKVKQLSTERESLDNVLKSIQVEKSEQDLRCDELESENRKLKEELENCKMALRQKDVKYMKDKEQLKKGLELEKELCELKKDREFKKKTAKLHESYHSKEKTFEAIKQIISGVDSGHRRSGKKYRGHSFSSANSDSEVEISSSKRQEAGQVNSSTFTRGGIFVSNPRLARARSSENDRWLEHTPGKTLETGTIFQASMKKKKSVTKLTSVKDLTQTSKYCLNLQEAGSDGEMETKLYKADVVPSVSGGAQVVFSDVEILKQVSPTGRSPRKRTSSVMVEVQEDRAADREETRRIIGEALARRCATGVGHQGTPKRPRRL